MKITPKQYARALYDAIEGKSKKEVGEAIKNFVVILSVNNAFSKLEKIIDEFEKIWNQDQGIVEVKVVSAKKISLGLEKEIGEYIKKLSSAKEIILTQEEDKKLLGGIVIKYEDKIIDGSLKTKISELKNNMTK